MPKTYLAQSTTKRRMDYIKGMLAGGLARSGKRTEDLAKKFGVTNSTIHNWIRNPETMSIRNFYYLCDELDIKISIEFKDIPE